LENLANEPEKQSNPDDRRRNREAVQIQVLWALNPPELYCGNTAPQWMIFLVPCNTFLGPD